MSLVQADELQPTSTVPGHHFGDSKNCLTCQVDILSIPTNIVVTTYSNCVEIIVTQTNGIGTVIHASQSNKDAIGISTASYTIEVKLQSRDTFFAEILARALAPLIIVDSIKLTLMCSFKPIKNSTEVDDFGDIVLDEQGQITL